MIGAGFGGIEIHAERRLRDAGDERDRGRDQNPDQDRARHAADNQNRDQHEAENRDLDRRRREIAEPHRCAGHADRDDAAIR